MGHVKIYNIYFNSIMVRLKEEYHLKKYHSIRVDFNSIMVRLKGTDVYDVDGFRGDFNSIMVRLKAANWV